MPDINFNTTIYVDSYDRSEFIRRLDVASNTLYTKVSAIPFGSELDPEDCLLNRLLGSRTIEKVRDIGNGITLYRLSHLIKGRLGDKLITGQFFIYKAEAFENIFMAVTLEDGDFFQRELKPALNYLYPEFLLPFIKSNSLKQLMLNFSRSNELSEIIIKRASQRLRFQDDKSMSAVTWPNMNLEDAFSFIHENNGWFKSLQFEGLRQESILAEISIDRHARIRTDRQFELVYLGFIEPAFEILSQNYSLFGNRSRRQIVDLKPKPLAIDFSSDIFEDIETNGTFIDALSTLDKASVSVLHGNPYVQMSVVDYIDGSNLDVWVLSNNQIIIVPQMKGTTAGIKRLVNHIFDTFAEGEVNNYEVTT